MEYPTFNPHRVGLKYYVHPWERAMGRRRRTNLDLPPRMYLRGSSYYYVDVSKRWTALGKDKARALRLWADLECIQVAVSVADLVRRWLADCMGGYAESTRVRYAAYGNTIDAKLGAIPIDDLSTFMLARWRDGGEVKPGWFNGCLAVLRKSYRKGLEWGWAKANPADAVSFNQMGERNREVFPAEFRAIRDHAITPRWLALAMDISYLTTLRESDVLGLRWEAVNEAMRVEQKKTGARQAFDVSPALRAVLEGARRIPIVGLFVVSTDKGRPISARRLQEAFARSCAAARVEDCRFHDIRGMGATEAKEQGLDYQAMLGHTTKKMSDKYIKARQTIKAPTLRKRL